MNLLHRAKMD